MVGVEHLLRKIEIRRDLGGLAPGQRQQPVEIVAHDRRFRGHRRHGAQLLELGLGLFLGFLGKLGLLDAGFQLGSLVAAVLALAEFLLDRLHLLVEVVLALGLLHLALDSAADALLHLEHGDFRLHEAHRPFQARLDGKRGEHFLLLGNLDREVRGDGVGKLRVIVDLRSRANHFRRNLLVQLDVVLEVGNHRARERLDLDFFLIRFLKQGRTRLVEVRAGGEGGDLGARSAFHQHLDGAVGELEELEHVGERADLVYGAGRRIVVGGILLGREQNLLLRAHHLFQGLDRFFAAHEERHDHVGEHHDIAQRQHRERIIAGSSGCLGHLSNLSCRFR